MNNTEESIREGKQPRRTNKFKEVLYIAGLACAALALSFVFFMLSLRWINPPFTAFTLKEDWEQLEAERYSLRDYWVPYSEIPDNIKWAVVASEDQNFWQHSGLDTEAIKKAMDEKDRGIRVRGASTITQQVAKNLFLSSRKTYLRKGVEAVCALTIDFLWSKERILEIYLNTAEFGPGIFGIGKASKHFFGKDASRIEADEAARLAAVLPNPKRMRAEPASPYVAERQYWILRNMTNLSGIAFYKPEKDSAAADTLVTPGDILIGRTRLDRLNVLPGQNRTMPADTSADSSVVWQETETAVQDTVSADSTA